MRVELRRARHAGWRALVATVLVMSGATAAHGWAGGHVPAWPGLLLLGGVVLGASTLLFRGVMSPRLLLPAVLAAQAGLHTSFVSMSDHAAHTAAAAAPSPWSGRMLLAHTAVALLTLLVWRLCERAAVAIVRVLDQTTPYVVGRVRRRSATLWHDAATTAAVLLTAPRRGPPVVARHA
ncbi:hypothetical protein [Nocardioides sp. GXQ0305]|uniref:hypothetical protein n=1 Tax=Nocardioides sp. GXQ0305 TaxID=3423912 RepID=UPI003D7D3F46